jgi:hypothetical protein
MVCIKCNSNRILNVCGKCDDRNSVSIGDRSVDNYIPNDLGIGGGDYIEFEVCLDCGQMVGDFPRGKSKMEASASDGLEDKLVQYFEKHLNIINDSQHYRISLMRSDAAKISDDFENYIRGFISDNAFDIKNDFPIVEDFATFLIMVKNNITLVEDL